MSSSQQEPDGRRTRVSWLEKLWVAFLAVGAVGWVIEQLRQGAFTTFLNTFTVRAAAVCLPLCAIPLAFAWLILATASFEDDEYDSAFHIGFFIFLLAALGAVGMLASVLRLVLFWL